MDRMRTLSAVASETFDPVSARHRPIKRSGFHKLTAAFLIACASVAAPVSAASDMTTKLVSCGADSCLQISGHREDPDQIVSINGQSVSVEGKNGWRVRLPVETVREWSELYAREIEVSLRDPKTQLETIASVELPIGLLGHVTELASLEVSAH